MPANFRALAAIDNGALWGSKTVAMAAWKMAAEKHRVQQPPLWLVWKYSCPGLARPGPTVQFYGHLAARLAQFSNRPAHTAYT